MSFADCDVGSAADAKPAASAGSGNVVRLDISNADDVKEVGIAFELFEEVDNKEGIILIISLIFFSKSSKINLFDNIISNSRFFIIIMIFFNSFLSSFRLKKINLLNIIFFFSYTSLYYKN